MRSRGIVYSNRKRVLYLSQFPLFMHSMVVLACGHYDHPDRLTPRPCLFTWPFSSHFRFRVVVTLYQRPIVKVDAYDSFERHLTC